MWKSGINGWGDDAGPKWFMQWKTTVKDFFTDSYTGGKIEKLGVYNPDSKQSLVFSPANGGSKDDALTAVLDHPPADSLEMASAIADAAANKYGKVIAPGGETVLPEIVDLPSGAFGKPADAPEHTRTAGVAVPSISENTADLTATP